MLFKDESGIEAPSQITAFEDTWHWHTGDTAETYHRLIMEGDKVSEMLQAFHSFIGQNQMMAYLVMMAARLKELHRVLKPTGSLYLHCDPTASHYLKILLDTIFDPENFLNEISWIRTSAHSSANRYGGIHDTLLFYGRTDRYKWNRTFTQYSPEYIDVFFDQTDEDGRKYKRTDLTGAGTRNGESGEPWRGIDVTATGRHWAVPAGMISRITGKAEGESLSTQQKLDLLDANGRIHWPKKQAGTPRLKQYPEDLPGVPLQDVITDIRPLHNLAAERLGYPTQKPVSLLERLLEASTDEGDIVLDPFCGCGTTIAAAQKLNREWIGIDVTHLSVGLQKLRLEDSFGLKAGKDYKVIGQPEDLSGAKKLAEEDKYGFQWWVLPLIGVRAFGAEKGSKIGKKGADGGIDGVRVFTDDGSGKAKKVIVSVKGGHVNVSQIRDLGHVIDRENAAIGVFVTLEPPTKPMLEEAAGKGFYTSPGWHKDYARLQILTVEDILTGKQPNIPHDYVQTFARAEKEDEVDHKDQISLF